MLRRFLLIGLVSLLLIPLLLAAWLLLTESGLDTIAGQLGRLERFGVRIEGVSGTLRGPLAIEHVEVDTASVHIVVTDIEAEPLLRAIVLQTAAFDWVRAASVEVVLKDSGDEAPRSGQAPKFLPSWLRVLGERVEIGSTRFATAGGFEIAADRVRGRIELSRERLSATDLLIEAPQFVAGGRVRLESQEVLRLDIATNGRLTLAQQPDVELVATLRGTSHRLEIDAHAESPAEADAALVITTGDAGWHIAGRLDSRDPQLRAWLEDPPVTPQDVHLELSINADGATIDGTAVIPEIDPAPLSLSAQGRYAERTLTIAAASVRPQDSPVIVTASGRATFGDARPQLDVLLEWQDFVWPLRESPLIRTPQGRLAVEGDWPYRITGSAQLEVPGQPAAEVALAAHVDAERLAVQTFTIVGAPGSVSGQGTLALAPPRRWQADLKGSRIDLSPWLPAVPSQIDVAAQIEGLGIDAGAQGSARIARLGGTLRGLPLAGSGSLSRTAKGWRAERLTVSAGANRIVVDGRLDDRIDARWTIDAPAIAALWPTAGGSLRFTGAASGPVDSPLIEASLEASDLNYEGRSIRSLTASAQIDLDTDAPSWIRLQAAEIGREDPVLSSIELSVEGRATDHELRVETTLVPAAEGEPPIALRLEAQGDYHDRAWTGSLRELTATHGSDEPLFALNAPAAVAASADAFDLAPVCLLIARANLCVRAAWEAGGPWAASGDVDRLPLEFLGDVLPGRPGYGGHVTMRFDARGHGSTLSDGNAQLKLVDGVLRYELVGGDLDAIEFGSGEVTVKVTPGSILADGRLDASEGTFVEADLNVARDPTLAFREQRLAGTIEMRSRDTGAITLVVPELDTVGGLLEAEFAVYGTVGAPRFDGTLALHDGKVELYRYNTLLHDIDFVARLHDRRIDIDGTCRLGEGMLEVDGSLIWRDLEPNGVVQFRGEKLLIADSPEVRIVASPDLEFDVTGRSIDVTGEVLIPAARIEPRDLGSASSVSADARLVGSDGEPPEERKSAFDVRAEVRVTLGDDVSIDAVGLSGRLDGSLVTRSGYANVDTGKGEIRIVDGKYEAYGQKLDITRGRLIFDGTTLGDPGLDIQAEKEVELVTVGLNVRGTLHDPRLSLYSDPSMPQNDILSYLLIGKPIDEAGSQEAAKVSSAASSLAISGGGFLASQIGRQFGLEEVAIESRGEDDTSLVLGKFLSPRLFVSYGISLTESINTAKLRYTITDKWVLKVEAGELQSADLEFKIER